MSLSFNPVSNVAIPLLTPSNSGTQVAFREDKLFIPGYSDDLLSTPNNAPKDYNRWYVCETNAGYLYTTLAWVMGDTTPQNPTCQKVDVVRVFI
jgi:hypothetical protein